MLLSGGQGEAEALQNPIGVGSQSGSLPSVSLHRKAWVPSQEWGMVAGGYPANPAPCFCLPLPDTSMMVENSAVCPALRPSTILSHSMAMLVLIGHLEL